MALAALGAAFGQSADSVRVTFAFDERAEAIRIDGAAIGSGARATATLATGERVLEAIENEREWGAGYVADTMTLTSADEGRTFRYSFGFRSVIASDPENAAVYAGEELLGHTPLLLRTPSASYRVAAPGYESRVIPIEEARRSPRVELRRIQFEREAPFHESPWFVALVGGAAAFGATAAYFKLEADDAFAEYRRTGSAEALDRVDRYDAISGAAFAAMQINFGYLAYRLLTD
jgi:hypothetical protein